MTSLDAGDRSRSLTGLRPLLTSLILATLLLAGAVWSYAMAPPLSRWSVRRLQSLATWHSTPYVLRTLVQRCTEDGRLEEAARAAERFTRIYPNEHEAHNALGIVYVNLGRYFEARDAFEQAIQVDPRPSAAYVNLGRLALIVGDYQRAMVEFDRATTIDPNSSRGWLGLGEAAAGLRYSAQATESLEKAIRLDPDRPEAYAALGSFLSEGGRGIEARRHLHRALELGGATGKVFASLAMAYADFPDSPADLERALDYARQGESLGDDSSLLHYARGVALQRLGRYPDAIESFKEVIRRNLNATGAWIGVSQCYRAVGKHKLADKAALIGQRILTQRQRLGTLRHQIRINPNRLELREQYAQRLMQNGSYLLAADEYRYVAQHRPNRPESWLKAAGAFELAGRADLARYLRKYVADRLEARRHDRSAGAPDHPLVLP